MSVINQMLKDLDNRRSRQDSASNTLSGLSPVRYDETNYIRWLIYAGIVIGIILIFLMLFTTIIYTYKQNATVTTPSTTPTPTVTHHTVSVTPAVENKILVAAKPEKKSAAPKNNVAEKNKHELPLPPPSINKKQIAKLAAIMQEEHPVKTVPPTTINFDSPTATTTAMKKTEIPLSPEEHADENYEAALALLQRGQITAAIDLFQQILATVPAYHPARQAWATLLFQRGELTQASDLLAIGLKQDSDYAPFIDLQAHILMQQGKLDAALRLLESTKPDIGETPDYYALLAALHQRLGNYARAVQIYTNVLAVEPDNAIWWLGLGVALESSNQNKMAINAYEHALDLGTLRPELRNYIDQRLEALEG